METIIFFNRVIKGPILKRNSSLLPKLEDVLGLATSVNRQSHFNIRHIEVVSCLTTLSQLVGDPSASPSVSGKAVAIFSKLVLVPCLREFCTVDLKLAIHLISYFRKGLVTDSEKLQYLNLLSTVTSGEYLKIDHAGGTSLNCIFKWLLELRNDPNQLVGNLALGTVSNLCRNVNFCHYYLGNIPALRLYLAEIVKSSDQNILTNIYSLSILLSTHTHKNILHSGIVENAFELAYQSIVSTDAVIQQASADLLILICTHDYARNMLLNEMSYDIVGSFENFISQLFENTSNPAATCEVLMAVFSLANKNNFALMITEGKEGFTSKFLDILSLWIKKSFEEDPKLPLNALKFVTQILKALPRDTNFDEMKILNDILDLAQQKILPESPSVFYYLEQRCLLFQCLLGLFNSDVPDNPITLNSLGIEVDVLREILDFTMNEPLTESKQADLCVEVSLLIIIFLDKFIERDSKFFQDIINNPKIVMFVNFALQSKSHRLIKTGLDFLMVPRIPNSFSKELCNYIGKRNEDVILVSEKICTPYCPQPHTNTNVPKSEKNIVTTSLTEKPSELASFLEEQLSDYSCKLNEMANLEMHLENLQHNLTRSITKESKHVAMMRELSKLLSNSERIRDETLRDSKQRAYQLETCQADLESANKLVNQIKLKLRETEEANKQLTCALNSTELSLNSKLDEIKGLKEISSVFNKQFETLQEKNNKTEEMLKRRESEKLDLANKLALKETELKESLTKYETEIKTALNTIKLKNNEIERISGTMKKLDCTVSEKNNRIVYLSKELQKVANIREMIASVDTEKVDMAASLK